MKYDVHFSIAGLIIYVLLLFILLIIYNKDQNTVKKLRDLIISLFLADFFDVASAYSIAYTQYVPVWVNYILNGLFFVFEGVCMAMLPRYVRCVIDPKNGRKNLFDHINAAIVAVYILLVASSPWTHFIFYFDGIKYHKGSLYNLTYTMGAYFLVSSFVRLIRNKKSFSSRQFSSIFFFIFIAVGGLILQFMMPGSLFVLYFSFSIASLITVFGLETPDSIKLERALIELEKSQGELKEAVIRAESADRAKSDFLANMSHEIRTPINAVLGMNELINRESNQPEIQGYSSNIADAGQTLLSLINDILDFSKIEAGRMELAPTDYSLSNLLREVSNIVKIRCEDKGLVFSIKNNPEIPSILHGDDVRIRQILINLLNNSLKYTDKGSVTLELDYQKLDSDSIELIMAVKDTGIGIKEEDLPSLFESFKRIDLENNRKREGTGLGLSITQSFVRLMEGSIDVSSVYGEGSVFTIRIPQTVVDATPVGKFKKESAKQEKKATYHATFTAPTASILVVDDVKINLSVIKGLLKQTDIKIDTAVSGLECLEKVKENTYDIIFLDHMMPEMDGVETIRKMKEDNSHINLTTPIIMLTANAILGAKEEYLSDGFTDYLSKPVQWNELEEMLRNYLPEDKVQKVEQL